MSNATDERIADATEAIASSLEDINTHLGNIAVLLGTIAENDNLEGIGNVLIGLLEEAKRHRRGTEARRPGQ